MGENDVSKIYEKLEELNNKFDEAIYIGRERPAVMPRLEKIEGWIKEETRTRTVRIDWATWIFRAGLIWLLYQNTGIKIGV